MLMASMLFFTKLLTVDPQRSGDSSQKAELFDNGRFAGRTADAIGGTASFSEIESCQSRVTSR